MPEEKIIRVYFEENDDAAFLKELMDATLLPAGWELTKRKASGKDGLFQEISAFVIPRSGVGRDAVVLIDLDDNSYDSLSNWFRNRLVEEVRKTAGDSAVEEGPGKGRVKSFRLAAADKPGRIALVAVGCPDYEELKTTYNIQRFAIDDWALRLATYRAVYEAVGEFKPVTFDTLTHKLVGVRNLFRENGLDISRSKAYMHIIGALTAIGPKSATIIERLLKKAFETLGAGGLREFLKPLLDDLFDADQLLRNS